MRIQNVETLISHGNRVGRKFVLELLEAGLEAADPYKNTGKLLRLETGKLIVGNKDFEPRGSPKTGEEIYDLSEIGNIYVFGAGKGCQRVAKALEDTLGGALKGGHVIDKKGHEVVLNRIGVTLGAHPVPDEDCIRGCERILGMIKGLRDDDLVFTVVANGVSSLLTMPVPGVTLEDVRDTTYIMQIERGAPTQDLNPIRNHLDMMKGGRISKYIHPSRMIHILAWYPDDYDQLMNHNLWLHTLPDCTSFQDAVFLLKKWDAWNAVPSSVRNHLEAANPSFETLKAKDFEKMSFRIFGVMPKQNGMVKTVQEKAKEIGLKPVVLTEWLMAEASQAGLVVADIAKSIEDTGQPFEPPCVLVTSGEMLVTVGKEEGGMGGRNQEFVLSAAQRIAGSKNVVIGSVDSDGTDGPCTQFVEGCGDIPCLAGGVVDGETVKTAKEVGVNIVEELRRHNSTPALWKLNSGIVATYSISMIDLSATLIMSRSAESGTGDEKNGV